jgi:RimJ/RimL family protein N-acetyltransferase
LIAMDRRLQAQLACNRAAVVSFHAFKEDLSMDILQSSVAAIGHDQPTWWYDRVSELDVSDQSGDLEAHFLRLPPDVRRTRFCTTASDRSVADYVRANRGRADVIIFAYACDGITRAVVEMFLYGDRAEVAFSVEPAWQGQGIGTALMRSAVGRAAAMNVERIELCCDSNNWRMRRIADRVNAATVVEDGDCFMTIKVAGTVH